MDRVVITTLITVVLIIGVALAVQFKWLGNGKVKTVVVFLVAVVAMLALRTGGVPPAWFAGGKVGFGIAVGFVVSGLLTRAGEARAFGLPLFLGLGLTLLVLNVLEFVRNVT